MRHILSRTYRIISLSNLGGDAMTTGFIKSAPSEKSPTVPYGFRHAMCFGESGCGKTSSFILPNIKERIKQKHGIFVLDYKGTLHPQVKAVAHELGRLKDVVEIGTPWGHEINILAGVSKSLFLEGLELLCGEEKEKFWSTSSLNMIGILYEALMLSAHLVSIGKSIGLNIDQPLPFNVQTMIEASRKKSGFEDFETKLRKLCDEFSEIKLSNVANRISPASYRLIEKYTKLILDHADKIEAFYESFDNDTPAAGNGGVQFQMHSLLLTFSTSGLNGTEDILSLLGENKIVLFRADDMPKRLNEVMMHLLYSRLAKRLNSNSPVSLVIDEFQRSVTKKSVPFVDVFREKKVELIAAVQNRELLEIVIGENETKAFLGNIVDQYAFEKEDFRYAHEKKISTAIPMFFDQSELDDIQVEWQKAIISPYEPLEEGWVYDRAADQYTCHIRHAKTGKQKMHFLLEKSKKATMEARKSIKALIQT